VNNDLRVTWTAPNNRGSPIIYYNIFVQNKTENKIVYDSCTNNETMCSISL